ncbi:MAG TPA: PmeII family type II restriction endonuclease [Bacteroidota bacterium]|nr:PmeII family type II restriction endonuclease [Bacteroidota bacterium]
MKELKLSDVQNYVNENIGTFHQNRVARLQQVKLKEVLRKKNPYLFRAKNILTAERLVESILDAFLSSSEEELFGNFLEGLAIFVASKTVNGTKSAATGIDLEFDKNGVKYLVAIKSGQNWGNSSQWLALRANFKKAVRVLRQSKQVKHVQPVVGSCYGRMKTVDDGQLIRMAGQSFWHFLSGNEKLYTEIIEPIGFQAKRHNDKYFEERAALVNRFTSEFASEFCTNGRIDWEKLVIFNSGNLGKSSQ